MPMLVSSSSALRLCGRLSRRMAISLCRSAANEAGKCAQNELDGFLEFTRALLLGRRRPFGGSGAISIRSCRCKLVFATSSGCLDQRTAAFIQWTECLFGRDSAYDLE